MPRTDEQNRQIRDERREQIMQAALKVFARRGMAAAKIGDIAAEAGLSNGLVYHYFKSKEEMFSEWVGRAVEGSRRVALYAGEQPGKAIDQLKWMTETILQSIRGEGAYLFLIMIQAMTSDAVPEDVKRLLDSESKASYALLATVPIIRRGQEEGTIIRENAEQLAVAYFSFIQGLAISRVQQPDCPLPKPETILRIFHKIL
ncbi:TetR/AcrR family transcriptional regulator [Ferviditalea candida]|uniref:Helix-turn-helix domain-containing protein n=1 Tax=Ferviditalea candida TaxID=3108399 RepID=A0ABU5ZCZ5_9BACL|nr:helix-turn-helix domain-containing protein [Paenibacillaceae bacterium T2]